MQFFQDVWLIPYERFGIWGLTPSVISWASQNKWNGQRHAKRDLRTLQIVQTKITPHTMFKTPLMRDQNGYTARKICAIDVTSVKKCRPWQDAASETRRLVWVYIFCICPKVLFRMMLAILYILCHPAFDHGPNIFYYYNDIDTYLGDCCEKWSHSLCSCFLFSGNW